MSREKQGLGNQILILFKLWLLLLCWVVLDKSLHFSEPVYVFSSKKYR